MGVVIPNATGVQCVVVTVDLEEEEAWQEVVPIVAWDVEETRPYSDVLCGQPVLPGQWATEKVDRGLLMVDGSVVCLRGDTYSTVEEFKEACKGRAKRKHRDIRLAKES